MLTVLAAAAFTLTSTAYANNANIPSKFTCDAGQTNPSPALAWTEAPAGTKSFALIMHDPDAPLAGGFTHWVLFDIPATASSLSVIGSTSMLFSGNGSVMPRWKACQRSAPDPIRIICAGSVSR